MKKNFFKKLSFVMALAMLISVIAPAAGVFAAATPALNKTAVYLHLSGISGSSEYDFNVSNKQTGWKYAWSSANKSVAVVESNGLTTAVGVGTTKVSVKITKDGKAVKTLSASVTVRDNIETVDITNVPAADVKVGETVDFNRSFVTESGSKVKTSSVTRWIVDKTTATIDNSGKFVATEAGEFKVTALSFQSTAKYEAWKTSKDASLVLASDEVTVKVAASIVSTVQVDTDTFVVTFDSDMSKSTLATEAVLYQLIGDTAVSTGAEKIKTVTLDKTGKIATFDMYAAFSAGSTYKLTFGKLVGSFKAASTNLSDVTKIVFDDFNIEVTDTDGVNMLDSVKGLNADGVVILSGAALVNNVTFTYGGDLTKGFTSSNVAYLYTEGYSATVTATFLNYVYDDAQKKYVEVKATDAAVATCVKADTNLKTTSLSYVVDKAIGNKNSDTTGWASSFQVPANDGVFYIHSKYQTNNVTDGTYTYNDAFFTYTSNDPDKLLVNGTTMVPLAQGTVTVLVKTASDGKVVGTFTVSIMPARTFVGATTNVGSITVGNSSVAGMAETKDVIITAKDSMNEVISGATVNAVTDVSYTNKPSGVTTPAFVITTDDTATDGTVKLSLTAAGAAAGAYTVKVVVHGLSTTKEVYFTVIVLEANTTTTDDAVTWAPVLDLTSVDLKDVTTDTTISADVYGYNAAGARVAQLTNAQFNISVKLNGTDVTSNVTSDATTDGIGVAKTNVSVLDLYAVGTYVVTVTAEGASNPTNRPDDAVIGYVQFTVKDSTTKSVAIKTSSVTKVTTTLDSISEAVLAAFEFKLNDTVINAGAGVFAFKTSDGTVTPAFTDGTGSITAGTTLYVDSVTYTIGNKVYTIDVKKTIAVK